jgi:cation diffusion facilitator CzcD-associated flavoprotein CzcO
MSDEQVVIVGAGTSGVAAALALKDVGVKSTVLERAEHVGASWRARYDRLRLNSPRFSSHLPGRPYPKGTPMFPSREQVIEHVERHVAEAGIEVRLGVMVDRIEPHNGGWAVRTSAGDLHAPQVVVAIGHDGEPKIPEWPGRESFAGTLIHSSAYRNPTPFQGQQVLVVGPGCSGMEIAYDLATGGAAKVWLAVRTPPNIVMRVGPGGMPGDVIARTLLHLPLTIADRAANFGRKMDVGDLTEYGLPIPQEGVFSRNRRLGVAPAILDKEVIEAIKSGDIEVVRGVESLDATGVQLSDGARVEPDAVVCATGWHTGLEQLVGHLGVLGERNVPVALAPEAAAPGLRFLGFLPRPSQLGYACAKAKPLARAIKRELASQPALAG